MYYEIWAPFDPDGTQYIKYEQLSDFLNVNVFLQQHMKYETFLNVGKLAGSRTPTSYS